MFSFPIGNKPRIKNDNPRMWKSSRSAVLLSYDKKTTAMDPEVTVIE